MQHESETVKVISLAFFSCDIPTRKQFGDDYKLFFSVFYCLLLIITVQLHKCIR